MSNGGRIKLTDAVIGIIKNYLQISPGIKESGGVLLGRFIKNSKDIVMDIITTPLKGDKQTKYSFKRLSPLHQKIIDDEWGQSKGTCNYLGEWHSHPEEVPEPSSVDIKDWKRKLKQDSFSSRYLYFIIAGTEEIRLWEGDRRTLTIKKLEIEKTNI